LGAIAGGVGVPLPHEPWGNATNEKKRKKALIDIAEQERGAPEIPAHRGSSELTLKKRKTDGSSLSILFVLLSRATDRFE
jgi:hypothetical protein